MIGFVHVRDMFEVDEARARAARCGSWCGPILFVPETKPVNALMRQMQQENTHMVMVVDEYGNTAGLATMEDLLEVIIGEIRDEHEPRATWRRTGTAGTSCRAISTWTAWSDLFASFHREEDIESTTVGGLVSEWLGRVPKSGEFVEHDGVSDRSAGERRAASRAGSHRQVANGGA